MNEFRESYYNAEEYPKNLLPNGSRSALLDETFKRFKDDEHRLFCSTDCATLVINMLELEEGETIYKEQEARTQPVLERLIKRFSDDDKSSHYDPMVRMVFFHAPNSRSALNTTHQMFTTAMSYNRVMPDFLDFVLPFGAQVDAEDFHFGAFRTDTQLRAPISQLPSLGRSGYFFQMCYNLKSVESTTRPGMKPASWPWSIRHTATHMSFDIENGRTNWVILKGNKLMLKRMKELTSGTQKVSNRVEAFTASLKVHAELCDWSREGWRWYIRFLEEQFYEGTKSPMLAELTKRPITTANEQRTNTNRVPTSSPQQPGRITTFINRAFTSKAKLEAEVAVTAPLQLVLSTAPSKKRIKEDANVAFPHLKKCQHIAEKCNEVLLVLKLNTQILNQLLDYYKSLRSRRDFPAELKTGTEDDMLEFESKISSAVTDFKIQQSRVETLVQLLGDRKTLLLSKMEQSQMLTNQDLSERAHHSTEKMMVMTESMEAIAKKTERETILVRIITVVTLLFLPATYVSTLMSTDIVRYQAQDPGSKPVRTYVPEALKLYFAITVPLTLLTGICAYIFKIWAYRKVEERDLEYGEKIHEVSD
jgi:hypothetical protein